MTIRKLLMKKNKITFATNVKGLLEHKELHPQPAKNFTPDWYKKMPTDVKQPGTFHSKVIPNIKTVRMCPSFVDVFKEGYVIPAPCDIYLKVLPNGEWQWQTPDEEYRLDIHEEEQFLNHLNGVSNIKKVFKLISPWVAITPKGWSVRQIPMIYNFNPNWQVAYGILNTDVEHELNQQIFFTSDNNEVLIKRGEPLNYLVPFKRNDKLKIEVTSYTSEVTKYVNKAQRLVNSSFKASIPYYRNS